MALRCPDCRGQTLEITRRVELGPDASSDENTFQLLACTDAACGLRAAAEYRESRRGALGSESWSHDGFRISAAEYARLLATARAQLDVRSNDRWLGIPGVCAEATGRFRVER